MIYYFTYLLPSLLKNISSYFFVSKKCIVTRPKGLNKQGCISLASRHKDLGIVLHCQLSRLGIQLIFFTIAYQCLTLLLLYAVNYVYNIICAEKLFFTKISPQALFKTQVSVTLACFSVKKNSLLSKHTGSAFCLLYIVYLIDPWDLGPESKA